MTKEDQSYIECFRKSYVKKNVESYIKYTIILSYFSSVEQGVEFNKYSNSSKYWNEMSLLCIIVLPVHQI